MPGRRRAGKPRLPAPPAGEKKQSFFAPPPMRKLLPFPFELCLL